MLVTRTSWAAVALGTAALLAACGDDNQGTGGSGTGASGPSTATGSGTLSTTGTAATGATTGSGGAPPCTAATLGDAVRVTPLAIDGAVSARAVTAEAGSGSVVAWAGNDGKVHVTPLDAVDQRAGNDLTVDGGEVFGVAASATDVALLVSRPPDYMTFVKIDMSGSVLATANLVGGGDHDVEGTEWFGDFARTGRLVGRADGTYAAYHALHRHWPDGVGHQGDTLRLLDASGNPMGGGWDWGCSHSMDQRLATSGAELVPICIADCYPAKGIYFNHDGAEITPDPAANCAGGFSTLLGGLVAGGAGFVLVYQDATGGAHLGAFGSAGEPLSDRALTVSGASRLARYEAGLLLGSDAGAGSTRIQPLDAGGVEVGLSASVAAQLPDEDFESRSDAEVAWAYAAGTTLDVVRVRVCDHPMK